MVGLPWLEVRVGDAQPEPVVVPVEPVKTPTPHPWRESHTTFVRRIHMGKQTRKDFPHLASLWDPQ